MELTGLPIYFLTSVADSPCPLRLDNTRIPYLPIDINKAMELAKDQSGGILLIDMETDRDTLDQITSSFGVHSSNHSMALIALISGRSKNHQQESIRRAFVIGAQEYILLDVASAFVSDRLRFLARHQMGFIKPSNETLGSHKGVIDTVTGLPTWDVVKDRLSLLLRESRSDNLATQGGSHSAILITVDRFRRLTAAYGLQECESVLSDIASRLRIALRELGRRLPLLEQATFNEIEHRPMLGRMQANDFIVIVPHIKRAQDCVVLAELFLSQFKQPFRIQRQDIQLSVSIGIAAGGDHVSSADELVRGANAAALDAKESGGNCYQIYTLGKSEGRAEIIERENRIRRALRDNEIQIYYQPQVDIVSNEVVGMEALARWHHPEEGIIEPDSFIPLLEESGLSDALGEYVLRRAVREVATWDNEKLDALKLSVNMNPQTLQSGDVVGLVRSILAETGLDPKRLTLEITESMVMDDPEAVLKVITQLQAMGVFLALDDFGVGYSSLGYLKSLPFNYLKIDKGFTQGLLHNNSDRGMIEAIISMGRTLSMSVVCEGVETEAELNWLSQEGCDCFQGYLCSKALPGEAFANFVRNNEYSKGAEKI